MQSAGGALQLMTCRVRAVRIAYMIAKPLIQVEIADRSRPLRNLHLKRGNNACSARAGRNGGRELAHLAVLGST